MTTRSDAIMKQRAEALGEELNRKWRVPTEKDLIRDLMPVAKSKDHKFRRFTLPHWTEARERLKVLYPDMDDPCWGFFEDDDDPGKWIVSASDSDDHPGRTIEQVARDLGKARTRSALAQTPRPENPIDPLVQAWLAIPRPGRRIEMRGDPIWPAPLAMTGEGRGRNETMPLLDVVAADPGSPSQLPMFGPEIDEYDGEFQASVLPVRMYQTAGKGAPLALRLMMRAVLDVPLEYRGDPVRLPRTKWKDVVKELMPTGYAPNKQWAGLCHGLHALESDERFLVPTRTDDGGMVGKRIVHVDEKPLSGHRSEWVRFIVSLPPGSNRGPIAHRVAWFLAAAHSTARFALATGLSVLWDRPGTARVKPNASAPFIQSTKPSQYSVLTKRALASLCWPNGFPERVRRPEAEHKALGHLRALEKDGYCIAVPDGSGWRVMPGASWPGWTAAQRPQVLAVSS